jgi:hypothetical protein
MMKGRSTPTKKRMSRDVAPEASSDLRNLYQPETGGHHLGKIAAALDGMAKVAALAVIAEHGSSEDREIALGYLKRRFEAFRSV